MSARASQARQRRGAERAGDERSREEELSSGGWSVIHRGVRCPHVSPARSARRRGAARLGSCSRTWSTSCGRVPAWAAARGAAVSVPSARTSERPCVSSPAWVRCTPPRPTAVRFGGRSSITRTAAAGICGHRWPRGWAWPSGRPAPTSSARPPRWSPPGIGLRPAPVRPGGPVGHGRPVGPGRLVRFGMLSRCWCRFRRRAGRHGSGAAITCAGWPQARLGATACARMRCCASAGPCTTRPA